MDVGAKALMVLHAAAAVVLIGSATHNAVLSTMALIGRAYRPRLQRVYAHVLAIAYAITFVLGLVNYPAFRLTVRAAYLDANVPLVTAFFEVKEHWTGIGLLIVACLWPLSRTIDVKRRSGDAVLYQILGITLAAIVWMAMFVGLITAAIRPVGGVGS